MAISVVEVYFMPLSTVAISNMKFVPAYSAYIMWYCTGDGCHWPKDSFGSGNDLVPLGNKPLPESKVDINFSCHWLHLYHNELLIYSHCRDDVIKCKKNPSYWPLCGDFTGHRWIPLTWASDVEPWYSLTSAPYWTVEQAIVSLVIWGAITLIMMSL